MPYILLRGRVPRLLGNGVPGLLRGGVSEIPLVGGHGRGSRVLRGGVLRGRGLGSRVLGHGVLRTCVLRSRVLGGRVLGGRVLGGGVLRTCVLGSRVLGGGVPLWRAGAVTRGRLLLERRLGRRRVPQAGRRRLLGRHRPVLAGSEPVAGALPLGRRRRGHFLLPSW
ncbi:hypothetical protein Psi01_18300 [Planobispora siamensis]|uniref:Uncharacterized protein n=1 Tax=Planobispora siamensis TaxID=936338 RepID=A0A8J3SDM8_9ACTN|nr:hypothetical protein Psi01_18300 [Planobispora siamensis]